MSRSSDGFNFGNNSTPFNPQFNVTNEHPLIKNSQDYLFTKKYVSIHSEDRDSIRYPDSSLFEIELPEDINNVYSLKLIDWTFPANYNTFSKANQNVTMVFKIDRPYNPNENSVDNSLASAIFEALYLTTSNLIFSIEDGFYNPSQLATTLTNKFNEAVSNKILSYFETQKTNPSSSNPSSYWEQAISDFLAQGQYSRFVIVYNNVGQKFWFGNIADGFTIDNEIIAVYNAILPNIECGAKATLKEFSSWGLSCNLGLSRCNAVADKGVINENGTELAYVPRFYYGDVLPGDNGYWLLPSSELPGSFVYFIEANFKINLMGPSHFYMELDNHNCLDETSPFSPSNYLSIRPNTTNGIVNSAFAKLPIPSTPITQYFDRNSLPYKSYDPPLDKIRKLSVKLRYHNNQLVSFGVFNYSFTLEFTTFLSQFKRKANIVNSVPGMQSV
jgi:hypothetical protein